MNRESRILSAIVSDRSAYTSIANIMDEADFSRTAWRVVAEIEEYYNSDKDANAVDMAIIQDKLAVAYPKHMPQFMLIIDAITEVSVPNVVAEYLALKSDGIKALLAEALIGKAGNEVVDELIDKLRTIHSTSDEGDDALSVVGIDEVLDSVKPENVIRVLPKALADRIDGGLIPGNQVVIYAPTETGKSLFAINMACGLLRDGRKVVYCGNEDARNAMLLRFYSNLSGMNKQEILASPKRAEQRAFDNGYALLVFKDMHPGTVRDIRVVVEKTKPEVVFVDQAANLHHANTNKVEKNELVAMEMRAMAKEYNMVSVLIHQASANAYGRLVLDRSDLHYSNVGLQGTADLMIGIGADATFEQQNKRMVTLTKNKISGDHSWFPIGIDTTKSVVVE